MGGNETFGANAVPTNANGGEGVAAAVRITRIARDYKSQAIFVRRPQAQSLTDLFGLDGAR